jgi:Tol biopolymer transport system component
MNADGSNAVQKTFTNDVLKPVWSPDGNRIAFTNTYTIMVMDLNSGAVSELTNTAGDYVSPTPAWSPDGTKIAFESDMARSTGSSAVFTISPDGSGLTMLTPFSFNILLNPAWSPDGMKLSVTSISNTGSIAVMNADGTGLTIINTGITSQYYGVTRTSWSPDGTLIAYTDSNTIKWVAANGSASGIIITNGWDADWKH